MTKHKAPATRKYPEHGVEDSCTHPIRVETIVSRQKSVLIGARQLHHEDCADQGDHVSRRDYQAPLVL